ncbi:MAG TPA: hypothetical protein VMW19_03425 [Myxococcota bacterium]|nr:hypothetical protein [Myxococcota bacterium]
MPEPGGDAALLALLEEHEGWRKRFYQSDPGDIDTRLVLLYAAGRTALAIPMLSLAIEMLPMEHVEKIRDWREPLSAVEKDVIVAIWEADREIASQAHTKFIAVGAEFGVRIPALALRLISQAGRSLRAKTEGRINDAIAAYGEALGAFEQIGREWKALSLRMRRGRPSTREARLERYQEIAEEHPELRDPLDRLILQAKEERQRAKPSSQVSEQDTGDGGSVEWNIQRGLNRALRDRRLRNQQDKN